MSRLQVALNVLIAFSVVAVGLLAWATYLLLDNILSVFEIAGGTY